VLGVAGCQDEKAHSLGQTPRSVLRLRQSAVFCEQTGPASWLSPTGPGQTYAGRLSR
jgi:hypothetical protein